MTVLISIFTLLGITGIVCLFWYAMIEAQTQAAKENENRNHWRK